MVLSLLPLALRTESARSAREPSYPNQLGAHGRVTHYTVCPKVPFKRNVHLFSAVCGWIPKSFGFLVAHIGGFEMAYKVALLTPKRPDVYWVTFKPYFDV